LFKIIIDVRSLLFYFLILQDRALEWSLSLGFNITINSIVCERHFNPQDILDPNLKMENGLNSKIKSLVPFALPVQFMNSVTKRRSIICCSVPECITNKIKEDEDISLFTPKNEVIFITIHKYCFKIIIDVLLFLFLLLILQESANKWSSILGLQLTEASVLCERHFRPHDMLQPTVMCDGVCKKVKSLVPFSLPMPRNASLSASNAMPFIQPSETHEVPVLRPRDDKIKRHKPDKLSCSKAIKNNVLGM